MLLTLGVGEIWAGIYECHVWLNGTEKDANDLKSDDWGNQTDLTLSKFYVKANKDGNDLWGESHMLYKVTDGPTTTGETDLNSNCSCNNWFNGGYDHYAQWDGTVYLSRNRKPGTYKFTFWFKSKTGSSSWCWYSNNSDNFNVTYTIPEPTISITGASSLVAGTSTDIVASMSDYPAGATLTRVDVTGNIASAKYNTGSSSSVTVSSVVPNASGSNGITVTVTVTYGSAGTKTYSYNYNVSPPAVSGFSVSPSGAGYVTGSGTSASPYMMKHDEGNLVLTMSGSQASSDANSSAQYYNGSSWSASTTKTIYQASGSTTKQNLTLKMRYKNNSTALYGAVSSKTIYYQLESAFNVKAAASPAAGGSVTPTSNTASGQYSGCAITATPNDGYTFGGWSGGTGSFVDASSANTTFKPTAASTVTATFNETMSTVNFVASPNGKGTFQVGGATVTSTTAGVTTTRSVTAVPISGYRFTGWSISGGATISSTTDNPTTVTGGGAGTAVTLTATFEEDITYYTLTFGKRSGESSYGSVAAKNSSTDAALSSGSNYLSGTGITVTATPADDYKFGSWYNAATSGSEVSTSNPYSFTLDAAKSVYAHFVRKTTSITLNKGIGSGGTTGPVTATHGSNTLSPTISVNPAKSGYTFTGYWTESSGGVKVIGTDGALIANVSGYTKSSNNQWDYDEESLTLYAQYTENFTTVTINVSPASTGTLTVGGEAFTPGNTTTAGVATSRTVVATAANDYAFSSWSVSGNATGTNTTNTYTLKGNGSAGTGTLTANFALIPCKLYKVSAAKNGSTTDKGAMSYDATEHAYYKDITTDASPYYFRFYYNSSAQYCTDWKDKYEGGYTSGKQITANGSKVTCDQSVGGWGDKPAMYYSGESGTTIRVWFDFQNKKVWITADKDKQYVLRGSKYDDSGNGGLPGWSATTSYLEGLASDNTGTITATLNASTKYKIKLYDLYSPAWMGNTSTSSETTMSNGTLYTMNSGDSYKNFVFTTTIAGSYTFTLDKSSGTKIKVDYPASYQLNYSIGSVAGTDGSITTSPSTSSGSYVSSGNSVTLTAPAPKAGYSWKGWFTNATGTTGHIEDEVRAITVTMNANKTLYACYTENDYTVTVAATAGGSITTPASPATTVTAHPATTAAIVAEEAEGYYFVNWTTEDAGITIANANNKSTTITATTAGTVTANFAELDKIYFRNSSTMSDGAWANVYVYFGVTWNGYENAISNANVAYKVAMTRIGTTDVYWAYVPHAFTSSGGTAIAFSNRSVGTSATINSGLAATRNDYNRALQMYVPSTTWADHGAHYYNDGYWKCYPIKVATGAGYYLQTTRGTNLVEFKGQADNSDKIECTVRVDEHDKDKVFHIKSAGGVYYEPYNYSTSTYPKISSSAPTMTMKSGDTDGLTVTLTSEGIYTFIIDQSASVMELTVGYPISPGDYRLKHTYNSGSKTTYSDVIKSGDAAEGQTLSMYLSTEGSRSLVLQKCTAIVAGSPRWTAGDETNLSGVLSTVGTNGNGVYQFDVKVSADKVASAPTATKYTGSYYIKTDGATGGWANYKQNSMEENTLNYDTDHPEKSFNYYYCKYYGDPGTNLKCVIANDYCNALTDTLVGDAVIGIGNQTTPSAASVRFSYNTYTNEIKRSYLGSSVNTDFLRILGNTAAGKPHIYDKAESTYDDSHADSYITFEDKQNWRYEIDVKADVNARAKLTASFNGQTQYFWGHAGESGHEWDNENTEELFGGESGTYGLTLVYDFKTNKLISAWKPTADPINSDLTLNSDILLLREHQGAPTTITFGQKGGSGDYASLSGVKTVYAVLRLNRWRLSNRANPTDLRSDHCSSAALIEEHHPGLSPGASGYLSQHERELYFISFPFDVKMSDIIDFGGYYDKWGIMYYDGKGRAKNGYWIDSESNWKYFTPEEFATKTLKAYEGYLIGIDLAAMAYNNTSFWTNNSCEVDIYFPSKTDVSSITQKAVDVDIDQTGYLCTINRDFGGEDGDRRIKDSYWHCIGVPSYANLSHEINNGAPDDEDWKNTSLLYLYEWNTETNEHSIMEASSFSFQAMYAYLVQYAGTTLSWAASATGPTPIAARRMKTEELRDRQFNLQLMQGDKEADHTYIRLSDDEEVTTGFEFNHDVSKMMLNGANIYTLIGTEQAAANSLPLNLEQTTVVPVGVKIATTGDYTFSIPEGTEGVGVTLVDNETGARTSLSALDYAIYLEAGTYNERFLLEISPIKLTPTSVDAVTDDGSQITDARKVMIDGLLYIVKDGVIYDARGAMVK